MNNKSESIIKQILEYARWTPSGDNMQTWRFEILDATQFVVHGYDTRDHCVYDLQGHASQLAIGALLESIAISASHFGYRADFKLRSDGQESKPTVDVVLTRDETIRPDPLFEYLPIRTVQRRSMKTRKLTSEQKEALELAVGKFYTIFWIEEWRDRWRAARVMFKNGKLRLTLPEAYPTHSSVIEWNARYSNDKIPDKAVGLDPIATRLMHWAMKSWKRVLFLNTYMAGTILPRIELDLMPGIRCAAHIALVAEQVPHSLEDFLNAGRAVQRFWLTVTQLGLQLQPEMTPLIFSGYLREKVEFTSEPKLMRYAEKIFKMFRELFGKDDIKPENVVFMGRIGHGKKVYARSLRLSVEQLISVATK